MTSLFPFFDKSEHLRSADPRMAQIVERFGYIERPTSAPLFQSLVRNIVSQQIAATVAERTLRELQKRVGRISPETIVALGVDGLRELGLPARKAGWLVAAAERFAAGEFRESELAGLTDEALLERLTSLRGVGRWSAQRLMMFSLSRENVLPDEDPAIRHALEVIYGESNLTPERMEHYRSLFSPYCSVAALYLWAYEAQLPPSRVEITIRSLGFARLKDKVVRYSFHTTPRGEMLVASSAKGVCRVAFADDREEALDELRAELKGAVLEEREDLCHRQIMALMEGRGPRKLTLYLEGTSFERKVWRELLKVPYGITVSYADIAAATGFTKAYRSVGNAVGANPIAVIIPCHRVIHADGSLGSYNAGADKKQSLLRGEVEKRM